MKKKQAFKAVFSVILVLTLIWAAGCSRDSDKAGEEKEQAQEEIAFDFQQAATLSFYNNIGIPDDYYRENIETFIKQKFPNVTIEYMNATSSGNSMANLITARTVPDMILTTTAQLINYSEMDVLQNLEPLIEANRVDLSLFRRDMIEAIRSYTNFDGLYALPWTYGTTALFYNKDLFDRFGVDYPRDGMTWDSPELRDMIAKLTRTEGDVHYRGFDMNLPRLIETNPLSIPFVDPATGMAAVNSDGWRLLLQTFMPLFQIVGNEKPDTSNGENAFIVNRTLAMWAGSAVYPRLIDLDNKGEGFNWDIVSLPTFKDAPGMGTQYFGALFGLSPTARHKDLAMQIIAHLTSDEVQIDGGRLLRFPTLESREVQEAFGQGEEALNRKNMHALLINSIPPTPQPTKYDNIARGRLTAKALEVIRGMKDINTALREAEEEANQLILAEKAK